MARKKILDIRIILGVIEGVSFLIAKTARYTKFSLFNIRQNCKNQIKIKLKCQILRRRETQRSRVFRGTERCKNHPQDKKESLKAKRASLFTPEKRHDRDILTKAKAYQCPKGHPKPRGRQGCYPISSSLCTLKNRCPCPK